MVFDNININADEKEKLAIGFIALFVFCVLSVTNFISLPTISYLALTGLIVGAVILIGGTRMRPKFSIKQVVAYIIGGLVSAVSLTSLLGISIAILQSFANIIYISAVIYLIYMLFIK